jgi:hypothetical protein
MRSAASLLSHPTPCAFVPVVNLAAGSDVAVVTARGLMIGLVGTSGLGDTIKVSPTVARRTSQLMVSTPCAAVAANQIGGARRLGSDVVLSASLVWEHLPIRTAV